MDAISDRIAAGFSRAVTRRSLLQRTMRWTFAAGAAAATSWKLTDTATAGGCGVGTVDTWGCYCASTPSCGSSKCCMSQTQSCCGGADPRCNYWGNWPYCWCSLKCCIKPVYGYFSCCDCWQYGNYGGCGSGNTKCVCKHRHGIRECP